ncbi:hypothetical protein FAI40_05550 [Acetobacteraceae bacterium]|nr:hypothetical protein FAI40_05550 [Acetobacteraceae bacterium]
MFALLAGLIPFTLFNFLAVVSPGLDFIFVSRTALISGKRAGVQAAFGVSVGCIFWGLAAFFGIQTLFKILPVFYVALKVVGGLYLVYTGIQMIRGSFKKQEEILEFAFQPAKNPFIRALFCNLANPKVPIFVTAIFTSCFPSNTPLWVGLLAVLVMFLTGVLWFSIVSVFLSAPKVAKWFFHKQSLIDRIAGSFFAGVGGFFIWEALQEGLKKS